MKFPLATIVANQRGTRKKEPASRHPVVDRHDDIHEGRRSGSAEYHRKGEAYLNRNPYFVGRRRRCDHAIRIPTPA